MRMEEQEIREEFDLLNLSYNFKVVGITNFDSVGNNSFKEKLSNSRGEFVGYYSTQNELVLFRDKIGGRNLYYAINDEKVYVSTDILWVLKNCKWELMLNSDYIIDEYLEFQVPFSEETIYKHVYKVRPAEMIIFLRKKIIKQRYWKLKFNENRFNPFDLHDLILDAVKFRKNIVGEEFTSYLSGGIDSSTITLLANPKESYSGFYEEEFYSELDYIKCLNRKFNPIKITEERFYRFFYHLPKLMPDPMCGLGVIPQLIVAMEAFKGGYRYVFTGEGGDEIFYGYNWNTAILKLAQAARDFQRDRYMVRYEGMIDKILHEGLSSLTASFIAKGENRERQLKLIERIWDNTLPPENNIFKINVELGLPAILTVDERVGIYSGVFNVSPLIDHQIIEYVVSINHEERSKIPKYLLREAIKGIVPEKIRMRYDKMGFPVPIKAWKWPMIKSLLESLNRREVISINPSETMDRQTWAFCNIELIYRELKNE